MNEFLKFFDEKKDSFPMHMEIYYSSMVDWSISVWTGRNGGYVNRKKIVNVQHPDIEYAFAKAQVELKDYLSEYEGGY